MPLNSAEGCSGLKPVISVLHQCLQSASRGCLGVGCFRVSWFSVRDHFGVSGLWSGAVRVILLQT